VYAENPAQDFLPSMGRLAHLSYPDAGCFNVNPHPLENDVFYAGEPFALRIDGGVNPGDEITGFYDPMISKIIAWGPDRDVALARLHAALSKTQIVGVHNNIAFLRRLIQDADFVAGALDTALINRRRDSLFPAPLLNDKVVAMALLAIELGRPEHRTVAESLSCDPWKTLKHWRLAGAVTHQRELVYNGESVHCVWQVFGDRAASFTVGTGHLAQHLTWSPPTLKRAEVLELSGELNSARLGAHVVWQADQLHVFVQGEHHVLSWLDPLKKAGEQQHEAGGLTSPMPGKVIAVMVKAGDVVKKGQALLVMEAMKMEHTLQAPKDGVIRVCHFTVGEQVGEGTAMLEFE
jgi:3-methylcrotonyl-CoA carboxylase alpha subunit